MRVLGSVDSSIGAQVAQSIAQSFADGTDTARIVAGASGGRGINSRLVASLPTPISIADVSTKSRQLDAGTFYAAGMAVFFLFFTVQFGITSVLEERRDGTLARMLVAPIHRSTVLVGKLLTSLVLGFVSMVVLAVATHFLLSAHWGNVLGVLILIAAGVLAATAVMTLVATLARTPDQAQSWQTMVALVLGMLGGSFFPVAQAGGLLAALSLATPQAWFLRGPGEHDRRCRRPRGPRACRRDPRFRGDHRGVRVHAPGEAGGAMKALAIAANDLRRLLRWRANIFFLFVLPMLIILLLGAAFGGSQKARFGILQSDRGPLAQQFATALARRPSVRIVATPAVARLSRPSHAATSMPVSSSLPTTTPASSAARP